MIFQSERVSSGALFGPPFICFDGGVLEIGMSSTLREIILVPRAGARRARNECQPGNAARSAGKIEQPNLAW